MEHQHPHPRTHTRSHTRLPRSLAKLEEVRRLLGDPGAPAAAPQQAGAAGGGHWGGGGRAGAGEGLTEVLAELAHHTELLGRIKQDLDTIYRKTRWGLQTRNI